MSWTAAAAVLGYAVQLGNGHLNADAIVLLQWSLGLALLAVLMPSMESTRSAELVSTLALGGVLTWQLTELFNAPPGIYIRDASDAGLRPFRVGVVLAGLLCAALMSRGPRQRRSRVSLFVLLLIVHFAMGAFVVRAAPDPFIDTYVFQRDSVLALLFGDNPYAITFVNIYRDETNYGPGLSHDGRLTFGFVYPPLSLLLAAAGAVLGGDVRFSHLVATTLAGAGMLALGAGRRVAALAAAVFLFTPRGFFVLEQSWTEPYLVCLFAWAAWSTARQTRSHPYFLGLLLAIKQHMALLVPLLWLLPTWPRSAKPLANLTLKAFIAAALVTLPFVLWSPLAFYRSAIIMQFQQPHRADALSFAATWAFDHAGEQLPHYLPFVAAAVSSVIALWRAPRTVSGFAGSAALVYLLFFAFAKQAFCNYYYYVIGLLCCAIAADRTPSGNTRGTALWKPFRGETR